MNDNKSIRHQLTIVVPVHNRADMVVRTLDSIAASSCKAFNLIIVDNASTDNTLDVCMQWAEGKRFEGLEIEVVEEKMDGAPAARNLGLKLCQTPFIYFFDSDDLFDSQFVGDMLDFIQKSSVKPDMVFVPVCQLLGDTVRTRSFIANAAPYKHILNLMLCTQSMLFDTEWLRQLGGWNEALTIWQDWELGLRALLSNPNIVWLTHKAYHKIVIHPDSITGKSLSSRVSNITYSLHHALKTIEDSQADETTKAKSRRALFFRANILAGKMAAEGNATAGSRIIQWIETELSRQVWSVRIVSYLLRRYTALGGKAAWRIGIAMC